jgi:DNA ligase 1
MDYSKLTELYTNLESTSKRLEKTSIISEFIKKIKKTDVDHLIYLIQGKVFAPWDERKIGVSTKLIIKALDTSTGTSKDKIEKMWAKIGDLGEVAAELVEKSKQSTLFTKKLTTRKVFDNIQKLSTLEGEGTVSRKIGLISELLTSASAAEARFVVRTVLEDMRVGVAAGTLRDSITWAFFGEKLGINYDEKKNDLVINSREEYNEYASKVQGAYDLLTDFGKVVEILIKDGEKGLAKIGLEVGRPVNVMLYQKVSQVEDAFKVVGKPAAIEYKYDGWRALIHIKGKEVKIFTRNLENVARQFPDVVDNIKKNVKAKECILDSEVIGYDPKGKMWLPFQAISQRIRRKHRIEELAKKIPVMVHVFDVLSYNGKNMLKQPFKKRRELIEKIVNVERDKVHWAKQIVTDDNRKAQKFYEESLKRGNEGVMFKNLEGIYKPGSRVGYGVKLKPTLDRLDLTIVGAEWGTGKRAKWFSSFTLACVDEDGKFREIGNVGTGIKEKETEDGVTFNELTEILSKLIIKEQNKKVKVKSEVVVEIDYEEIQKSTTYSSGYALRFPRVVRLRYGDKNSDDSTSLVEIEKIYQKQRGRNL